MLQGSRNPQQASSGFFPNKNGGHVQVLRASCFFSVPTWGPFLEHGLCVLAFVTYAPRAQWRAQPLRPQKATLGFFFQWGGERLSFGSSETTPNGSLHGRCWETSYNLFACCGLVGNPHLTARIYFCCSPSTVNQEPGRTNFRRRPALEPMS